MPSGTTGSGSRPKLMPMVPLSPHHQSKSAGLVSAAACSRSAPDPNQATLAWTSPRRLTRHRGPMPAQGLGLEHGQLSARSQLMLSHSSTVTICRYVDVEDPFGWMPLHKATLSNGECAPLLVCCPGMRIGGQLGSPLFSKHHWIGCSTLLRLKGSRIREIKENRGGGEGSKEFNL